MDGECCHPCRPCIAEEIPPMDIYTAATRIPQHLVNDPPCGPPQYPFNDNQLPPTDYPEPPIRQTDAPGWEKIPPEPIPTTVMEYRKVDESCEPPCYMPQPNANTEEPILSHVMGPIGPWASGKVDWTPLGGLTGTRPIVDKYSITRYSTNEWRNRNLEVLDNSYKSYQLSLANDSNCRNTMKRTYALVDRTQADSTNRLKDRARLVDKFKNSLERAIHAQIEEIVLLEEQRQRIKQALGILQLPRSIVNECIERRCSRPDTELVRDEPEEQLIRESALIAEIRNLLLQTLADVEKQQMDNRNARHRLEYDWSDKKDAHEIESVNCGLNNRSTTAIFRPGATRFPAEQSSEEFWEHFTTETLEACELCRQRSIQLRSTLNAILINAARDLRTQADTVESAFKDRIACMEEARVRLENELQQCLQQLADTEKLIIKMTRGMQGLDPTMKVVQSRLYNRNDRPHVENCRDRVQFGLVEEVGIIQDGVSAMLAALNAAERTKNELMMTRGRLEREIMLKRRTINLDKDRCMLIRSHFPTTTALSGFVTI